MNVADRLVVAADFTDPDIRLARADVMKLATELQKNGVIIKINSILRACGYQLIADLKELGVHVMADLKLYDIPNTLGDDGNFLAQYAPDIVTVAASAGQDSIRALWKTLPDTTKIFAVTVLTSLRVKGVQDIYNADIQRTVANLANVALEGGADGIVCSPAELSFLKADKRFEDTLFMTPGIRPAWTVVENDDQNPDRVMMPAKAIEAGADYLVVGRPITQAPDRPVATALTVAEMAPAFADRLS